MIAFYLAVLCDIWPTHKLQWEPKKREKKKKEDVTKVRRCICLFQIGQGQVQPLQQETVK